MNTYIAELRSNRAAIVRQMSETLNSKHADKLARWTELDQKQEKLKAEIEVAERREKAQLPSVNSEIERGLERGLTPLEERLSSPEYRRDFRHWALTGEQSHEMRALGDATGQPGANLVPIGFQKELEAKIKYWGGLINICRTVTTPTGNPLYWPTMDDTGNTAEWLAEGNPTNSADPTLGNVILGANLISSKVVKVSVQLAQDSFESVEGILSEAFSERIGRTLDTAYMTGDGSTIPVTGLLTALIAAGGRSVLAVGSNSNDGTGTDLNSVGTDDFSALIDNLDRGYQTPTNRFVFAQSTQNALRKLKDKYGRPVWEVSLAQGEPDKIFGYGYQIDNAMAGIGAGNIPVMFGDFSKYIIRNSLGITMVRFNELYMPNYQIGFQSFMEPMRSLHRRRSRTCRPR